MRVVAIKNLKGEAENRLIHAMHRLRAAFSVVDRLGKPVAHPVLKEATSTSWVPHTSFASTVATLWSDTRACSRRYSQLLEMAHLSTYHRMIQSSRFCRGTNTAVEREQAGLRLATLVMFAGIVEWSILSGYREFVTATDVRLKRILRRADWPLSRLGAPAQINESRSVAGLLLADRQSLDRRRRGASSSDFSIYQTEAA